MRRAKFTCYAPYTIAANSFHTFVNLFSHFIYEATAFTTRVHREKDKIIPTEWQRT